MEMEINENLPSSAAVVASPGVRRVRHEEKLAVRLRRLVERRTNGQVQSLEVEIVEQGVVLRGICATFYCKQLAQHAVMDGTERTVINRIDVREGAAPR